MEKKIVSKIVDRMILGSQRELIRRPRPKNTSTTIMNRAAQSENAHGITPVSTKASSKDSTGNNLATPEKIKNPPMRKRKA